VTGNTIVPEEKNEDELNRINDGLYTFVLVTIKINEKHLTIDHDINNYQKQRIWLSARAETNNLNQAEPLFFLIYPN
jgi:hypothetical protein